jgi:hypothetical protein
VPQRRRALADAAQFRLREVTEQRIELQEKLDALEREAEQRYRELEEALDEIRMADPDAARAILREKIRRLRIGSRSGPWVDDDDL